MPARHMSATDFVGLLHSASEPAAILDIRTPAEVAREHMPNCIFLPLQQLTRDSLNTAIENHPQGNTVYLLCQSGMRAEAAVRQLGSVEAIELVILQGGLNAIKQSGGKTIRGDGKTVSLERQVRIAAGTMVLVGVVLALNLHIGFLTVSAFVGAGLIFAGIADRCGLAFLLARMPWNH